MSAFEGANEGGLEEPMFVVPADGSPLSQDRLEHPQLPPLKEHLSVFLKK